MLNLGHGIVVEGWMIVMKNKYNKNYENKA